MVNKWIGKFHIRNLEIFTFIALFACYFLAIIVEPGTWLYNSIVSISDYWYTLATESGSALWMSFLFSILGNSTILIVIPYALIIFDIARVYENWVLVGLIAGLGAAIGEITSYLIGRLIGTSKKVTESETGEKISRIRRKFEEKPMSIPITVFFFAMTPLPDDAILVPLGMMKYSYWKSVLPCFLGKCVLTLIMTGLGHLLFINANYLNLLIDSYPFLVFLKLFVPSEEINPSLDLIQVSFVFILIYIMIRLDFEKISLMFNKDRRKFEHILLKGGNYEEEELIDLFSIENKDNFHEILIKMVEKYDNIKQRNSLFHFEVLMEKKTAKTQSMEFFENLHDQ